MTDYAETALVLTVLTTLALLGTSRLRMCIKIVAIQGCLLGILPLLLETGEIATHTEWVAAATLIIKGIILPLILYRALRGSPINREVEPYIGYIASILLGMVALVGSLWLTTRLPLENENPPSLLVVVAMFNTLAGLIVIATRRKALTQVLGYLVMENGIYAFGVGVARHQALLVEMGVLLDILVAVFVMGIVLFRIHHEFERQDGEPDAELGDSSELGEAP